jgi:hypothetical protein
MEATLLAYPLFNCIQPLIATAAIGNFPQTIVQSTQPNPARAAGRTLIPATASPLGE